MYFYLKDTESQGTNTVVTKSALSVKDAWKFESYRAALASNFAMGWTALGLRVSLMPLAAVALLVQYHSGENYDPEAGGIVLAGVAMALYAAGNAVSQNISGALSDRRGRRGLIFSGLLLASCATVAVGLSPTPLLFCLFSALTGIGTGMVAPSLQASVADVIGSERSGGTVLSTYQMLSDLGQIVGPLCAGFIAERWGFGVAFGVSAVMMLVTSVKWRPGKTPLFPVELADPSYRAR